MEELFSKQILEKIEAKIHFFEDFGKLNEYSFGYKKALIDIRQLIRSYREIEKHQIIDGFDNGQLKTNKNGIEYFKKTYKNERTTKGKRNI